MICNSHCQSMLPVGCSMHTLNILECAAQDQFSVLSVFVIFALWKSPFGKGSPIGDLRSLPFMSSSDNHFPSFLFIFKLFGLIFWNTDAKMVGAFSTIVSHCSYDWWRWIAKERKVGEKLNEEVLSWRKNWTVELFSLHVQKLLPRISLQRKSRVKHRFLTLFLNYIIVKPSAGRACLISAKSCQFVTEYFLMHNRLP